MKKNDSYSYFASVNTTSGFCNNFDMVFHPQKFDKIFILKGGPGTGKSTLLKRLATAASEQDLTVEQFLCSSDPHSLDGIIIKEKRVVIIDGTSPHCMDARFPGVVDNIVNLGTFWNKELLLPNKSEIIHLIQTKNKFYKQSYRFLKVYGDITREMHNIAIDALNEKKMIDNLKIQCDKIFKKGTVFTEEIRNTETYCSEGLVHLDSFERQSDKIWIIEDILNTGNYYLKQLYDTAKKENQPIIVSYSCQALDMPNAIYFPLSRSTFVIGERKYENEIPQKSYQYINMKRFLNQEKMKSNRQKLRFGKKCSDMILDAAIEALKEAKNTHEKTEQIYTAAMDFKQAEILFQALTEEIF